MTQYFLKNIQKGIFIWIIFQIFSCNIHQKINKTPDFTQNQTKLILEKDCLSPMRIWLITNKSDSLLLRKKSQYVDLSKDRTVLKHFVKRLYKTVTDPNSLGVGIAAPQVGILKNIIWVQRLDKPDMPFEVYINPVIKQYSKQKRPCPEGCLSIPNYRAKTLDRAYTILIEYDKIDGSHHIEMVEDFTSVIFQHEIDHLNGILFIDHLQEEMDDAREK